MMSDSPPGLEAAAASHVGPTLQDLPVVQYPSQVDSSPRNERIARPGLGELLSRPAAERAREYRYRFGQAVVFGLPVIALQLWGHRLGGREAARWAGVFQALLAGWVVYVAAAGMLFEGALLLARRRRLTADLVCAAAAVGVYLFSAIRLVHVLFGSAETRPVFQWVIVILGTWSGVRWWQFSRRLQPERRGSDLR